MCLRNVYVWKKMIAKSGWNVLLTIGSDATKYFCVPTTRFNAAVVDSDVLVWTRIVIPTFVRWILLGAFCVSSCIRCLSYFIQMAAWYASRMVCARIYLGLLCVHQIDWMKWTEWVSQFVCAGWAVSYQWTIATIYSHLSKNEAISHLEIDHIAESFRTASN